MLDQLPPLSQTAKLFTADAVSMYTNIDTKHALQVIDRYITKLEENNNLRKAIMKILEIIMNNNIIQFGDTYWLQLDGTAMGTNPACPWATLYFAPKEEALMKSFLEIVVLGRYIDDIQGIWDSEFMTIDESMRFKSLQNEANQFGKLTWEFSKLDKEAIFLDLRLKIDSMGRIQTAVYEKDMNLYQYLPPHSNHPYGCLKGLVVGTINRVYTLTSEETQRKKQLRLLFKRLLARGYKRKHLYELFRNAITKATHHKPLPIKLPSSNIKENGPPLIFHLPFHRHDPKGNVIQQLFYDEIYKPKDGGAYLHEIPHKPYKGHCISPCKLIVAYHRTPNLSNLLSSRIVRTGNGPPVSAYIATST